MAKFRNVASNETVQNWWDNGNNQIAFSRGNKAFIAINNDAYAMNVVLKTGLSGGTYCDMISGDKINGFCTGEMIDVLADGTAKINLRNNIEDPMIAIHAESKL